MRAIDKFFAFFRAPALPPDARHTYVRHLSYVVLDAIAAGIIANAPVMAIKGMGSPDWQQALQLSISSIGMFLVLYLGSRMANRHKMPFVLVPGFAFAVCSLLMAAVDDVLLFLIFFGMGTLFEVLLRPAVTAVVRLNYPAELRGAATGEIRKWSSLLFLTASLTSSFLLQLFAANPRPMIKGQMIFAGLLSIGGYLIFRTIHVKELPSNAARKRESVFASMTNAWHIVRRDRRFRRYLELGLLYSFGGLCYVSFIPVFLTKDLEFGYVGATMLIHIIPSVVAFLTTGLIGRWIDKVNTWRAWAWIRLGWGLDPFILAATPALSAVFPPARIALPLLGRFSRGSVMGGSWILWWQVGVNHFAPPGGDTTRYMGIVIFVNGLARLFAPLFGAWMLATSSMPSLFLYGGAMVLTTSLMSLREYRRESRENRLATMAKFEESFKSTQN